MSISLAYAAVCLLRILKRFLLIRAIYGTSSFKEHDNRCSNTYSRLSNVMATYPRLSNVMVIEAALQFLSFFLVVYKYGCGEYIIVCWPQFCFEINMRLLWIIFKQNLSFLALIISVPNKHHMPINTQVVFYKDDIEAVY